MSGSGRWPVPEVEIVSLATCPKCRSGQMQPAYVGPGTCSDAKCRIEHRVECRDHDYVSTRLHPVGEHLHLRCSACRYQRVEAVADA